MIREMAEACAKIYFRGKHPSFTEYNMYVQRFIRAYRSQVK